MVRTYRRKGPYSIYTTEVIHDALHEIKIGKKSVKEVQESLQIKSSTLYYYLKKIEHVNPIKDEDITFKRKAPRQIFTLEIENDLANHILLCADVYIGLNPENVRKLAYDVAVANNFKVPESWIKNQSAGPDWFTSFMKRHSHLSLRVPEATSLARVSNFNEENVKCFFNNLESVLIKHRFSARDIYNMDETGITTAHKPNKIIGLKGRKQLGAIVSSERGELVTMAATVSASGNTLPPFFLFPRVNFRDSMLYSAPEESVGIANRSGWMTKELFYKYLQHFKTYSRCSKKRPCLLLLDNHISHVSYESVIFAKNNGIVMLTFPPHCSHKLQPLDRTVYGPLKTAVNKESGDWIALHPKKAMRIENIPGIIKKVYAKVFRVENIVSGFKVTGIHPFNRNIFQDYEFAPSSITNQTILNIETVSNEDNVTKSVRHCPKYVVPINVLQDNGVSRTISSEQNYVPPAELRPILTASPRMMPSKTKSRKGRTKILTDSEEILEIENIENVRKEKQKRTKSKDTSSEVIPKKKIKKEKCDKTIVLKNKEGINIRKIKLQEIKNERIIIKPKAKTKNCDEAKNSLNCHGFENKVKRIVKPNVRLLGYL